ncbi:MAG: hypothetical protein ACE5FT_00285 [Candidatus Nanoarchaeia archaeon]
MRRKTLAGVLVGLIGTSALASEYVHDFTKRAEVSEVRYLSEKLKDSMISEIGLRDPGIPVSVELYDEGTFRRMVSEYQKEGELIGQDPPTIMDKFYRGEKLSRAVIKLRNNLVEERKFTGKPLTLDVALLDTAHEWGHIIGNNKDKVREEALAMLWDLYAIEFLQERSEHFRKFSKVTPRDYVPGLGNLSENEEAYRIVEHALEEYGSAKNAFIGLIRISL